MGREARCPQTKSEHHRGSRVNNCPGLLGSLPGWASIQMHVHARVGDAVVTGVRTELRPSKATRACAARLTTRSPRRPSMLRLLQTVATFSLMSLETVTLGRRFCAAVIFSCTTRTLHDRYVWAPRVHQCSHRMNLEPVSLDGVMPRQHIPRIQLSFSRQRMSQQALQRIGWN